MAELERGGAAQQTNLLTPDQMAQALIRAARAGDAMRMVPQARHSLAAFPNHLGLLQAMVELSTAIGDFPGALQHAERMVEVAPTQPMAHLMLASCHMQAYRGAKALDFLRKAEALAGNDLAVLSLLAKNFEKLDAMNDALRVLERLDRAKPNDGVTLQRIAAVHRFLGDLELSETFCDRSIAASPGDCYVYFLRSGLRKQTRERNHTQELSSLLERGIADRRGRVHVRYALAKEYEDLAEYDRAFDALQTASADQREGMQYDINLDLQTIKEIKTHFNAGYFKSIKPGHPAADPIFVIGMPRTGTTLVERIIGTHSQVRALGELGLFGRLMVRGVKEMARTPQIPVGDRVKLTSQLDFGKIGESYIAGVRDRRISGEPFFTDKLPYNYLNIGPIHAALPNSKIVVLERHPMDTCFAIYKTLFGQAYPFSYSMEELGLYFAAYTDLVAHWRSVLPKDRILTIRYEDLIANQEKESRRIFAYCGLKWEDQVKDFHKNTQTSTTASAAQVRQPIYNTSVAKWRQFEKHLAPLRKVLAANGVKGLD